MADILECIAGVFWIALGIYTWLKVRRHDFPSPAKSVHDAHFLGD